MASMLTSAFAGLATLLAAIGLYGVLAFNVARRTREIGIRMALGAGRGNVRVMVVREVVLMLVIGTAVGITAAAAVGRVMEAYLYQMNVYDLFIYSSAAAVLWSIALSAAYFPAQKATSIDPAIALREMG
jgi:ABC-type antimicrobial peptide transport system permease subunit